MIKPEDTEWDTRRCRILDPQGQEWSAGTYEPETTWCISSPGAPHHHSEAVGE